MTEQWLGNPARKPWETVTVQSVAPIKAEVARVAAAISADAHDDPAEFVRQARHAAMLLPASLRELLDDFAVLGDGGLLLTGLMVGPLPPTPASPMSALTRNTLMAKQCAAIMSSICYLAGFQGESGGAPIQAVVPVKADQFEQMSTGSLNELDPHTEQAFSDFRPDYIGLGGLRGDRHAHTYLLSARTLVEHLPRSIVQLLREPQFYTGVDASFIRGGASPHVRGPMPVLNGPLDDPVFRFDGELMFSPSRNHQHALQAVTAVYRQHRSSVTLGPGDLLIVDNSRGIHGRSPYHPQYDTGDRWLCRVQGHANPAATRLVRRPGSPIIEPEGS